MQIERTELDAKRYNIAKGSLFRFEAKSQGEDFDPSDDEFQTSRCLVESENPIFLGKSSDWWLLQLAIASKSDFAKSSTTYIKELKKRYEYWEVQAVRHFSSIGSKRRI